MDIYDDLDCGPSYSDKDFELKFDITDSEPEVIIEDSIYRDDDYW